ncbi:hypothetical protein AB0K35_28465 [Micromonospora sp. NPDC053740]|uniref:hypothetical protein n=1 Tax=Micromonospora sp. NPDC053740 TaxID=3155173 RepID=UPI00342FF3C9
MTARFRDAIPSMLESEAHASREEWRRLESRRQWWWIAVCWAVGAAVLVSALLALSGGEWR